MKIQHILFPTDFSDLSEATEAHVRQFAQHFGAQVTALHVIELPAAFYGMSAGYFFETPDAESLQDRARETMQSVLPGMVAERAVKLGNPAFVIAEFAEANAVDLIMMPTHGYGPFRRALIGSVTAKVLHDAKCPVWTMAHAETPAEGGPLDLNRIVCAVDLVPESVPVVRKAADLAQSFGAQLWLAHAVPRVHTFHDQYAGEADLWAVQRQHFYADHARQEIAKVQAEAGTHFNICVDAGPVAEVIAEVARKHRAHLVVTGRGAMEHFLGTVRSHAYPIIHEAPCPVVSL